MHPKEQAWVVKKFVELLNIAYSGSDIPPTNSNSKSIASQPLVFKAPSGIFLLPPGASEVYKELRDKVLHVPYVAEKFSTAYIEEAMNHWFAQLFYDKVRTIEAVTTEFDRFLQGLHDYAIEMTFYIPLTGINMQVEALKLGNVTLAPFTESALRTLEKRLRAIIEREPSATAPIEQKEKFLLRALRLAQQNLLGAICAKITINAEPTKARERAEAECRGIIDLLRYTIPSLYDAQLNVVVGIQGFDTAEARQYTTIGIGSTGSVRYGFQALGPLQNFEITKENVKVMRTVGVYDLLRLLQKPKESRTEFEQTILSAVHWFANAQTEVDVSYKFLSLIICLETFFTRQKGEPISATLSEGVAFVLSKALVERRNLRARIRELYDLRSEVSHGGGAAITKDVTEELQYLTYNVLRQLIRMRAQFATKKQFMDWLDDQKFK